MSLSEKVCIKTPSGNLDGELFIGADGLPELVLDSQLECESYRPATFPAVWTLCTEDPHYDVGGVVEGILIGSWARIEQIQREITTAKREAEETAQHEQ